MSEKKSIFHTELLEDEDGYITIEGGGDIVNMGYLFILARLLTEIAMQAPGVDEEGAKLACDLLVSLAQQTGIGLDEDNKEIRIVRKEEEGR